MKRKIEVEKDGELPAGLVAQEAEIVFLHSGGAFVAASKLVDCRILAKRLKGVDWSLVKLERCRFSGVFSENEFGSRTLALPDGRVISGGIEQCSFEEARLDECRFFSCDVSRIEFPKWPGFLVLHPRRNGQRLVKIPWPGQLGIWASTLASESADVVAVACDAAELAKREKIKTDRLRLLVGRLGDAVVIT